MGYKQLKGILVIEKAQVASMYQMLLKGFVTSCTICDIFARLNKIYKKEQGS